MVVNEEQSLSQRVIQACMQEKLIDYEIANNTLCVKLDSEKKLIATIQSFALNKFKINSPLFLQTKNEIYPLKKLYSVLNLIRTTLKMTIDPAKWAQFVAEVKNCKRNTVLSTTFMQGFNLELAKKIATTNSHTLSNYLLQHYTQEQQLIFFEQWAARGHPYHPCNKTKSGFTKKEYMQYSPEFNPDVDLLVAAIHKTCMQVSTENKLGFTEWFAQQFPALYETWLEKLRDMKLTPGNFYPIFIHPWQYQKKLKLAFKDLIQTKHLLLLPKLKIKAKPSLSFRTMILKERLLPHIKLPVGIYSTSAMRTISAPSVQNGPQISRVLQSILQKETAIAHYLKLAYELYGLHSTHKDPEIAKHLAIIYRNNPALHVNPQQLPIVVAALFEKSPTQDLPFFIEIMLSKINNTLAAAEAYFADYCRLTLMTFFDLFLKYGIALEGHQQNTIAVFENNQLAYYILRDLGGLRIHQPTLEQHGYTIDFYPDSFNCTTHAKDATNTFLHTVIFCHLGEIILLLAKHFAVDEKLFWRILKNELLTRFNLLKPHVDSTRWQEEFAAILHADWDLKCLMQMRLKNYSRDYIYLPLHNPLRNIEC